MGTTNILGSTENKKEFVNFTQNNWELQPQHSRRLQYGQYNTFRHRITRQQLDKYTLAFHSEAQQNNYYQGFLERVREDYLVNTVYYQRKDQKQLCSNFYEGEAYIQHIPVRLSEITDIPFEEFLYMLKFSLLGFQKLYRQVGYFQVKEDLVCIDKEGKLRVWMNSDLSKNYPQCLVKENESLDSEREMVEQILTLIERNTEDREGLQVNISLYFQRKGIKHPTFPQALDLIDQYVKEYRVTLPKYCESVIEIFKDDFGAEFNVENSAFLANGEPQTHNHQNILQNNLSERQSDKLSKNILLLNPPKRKITSHRPSHSEPYQLERYAESSESREFMLSYIKQNSDRGFMQSSPQYTPNIYDSFQLKKSSEKSSYLQYSSSISFPKITFTYNRALDHSSPHGSSRETKNLLFYQPSELKIEEKEQILELEENPQGRKNSMQYATPDALIELDDQIYNDMLKYL